MRHWGWIAGICFVLVGGCYNWRAAVMHTAAFEHHCPETSVRILGDDGDAIARSVQLDVCGEERTYRDVGGSRAYVWVDYSRPLQSTSSDEAAPTTPRARAATGSSSPWTDAESLAFVRSANDAVIACVDGQSVSARFTIDGQGRGTGATGLVPTPSGEELACITHALEATHVEGTRRPRRISARFTAMISEQSAQGADTESAEAEPTEPASAFPDVVRARITAAAAPILSCVGASSTAIQAEWQPTGRVSFTIRGNTDTLLDDCVRAAVGSIDVPASTSAGRLLHPVSR